MRRPTPRSSRRIGTPAALATLVLLGALTGCTATIVDRGKDGADDTVSPPSASTSAPPVEPETAEPGDSAKAGGELSAANAADRERLVAEATTTMPCPTETMNQDGAVIRVEGSCADLVIDIDAGVVIADNVTNLTLSGSGTVIYAETIGSLTVTGSASVVYWTGETPTVDDRGTANTLVHG
ncbi:DUF3060 domain-containing protein [Microbacterium oxydans]|uniref:DUF3060 domain-containing protein n=1 Tax=Microbacterium oxydans TaxID=82380 RepID=UPI00366E27C2